jgi:hypothetical protein
MLRLWIASAAAVVIAATLPARAADHRDGTAATMDPSADITDLYAWNSATASKVYLVMDVYPGATATTQFSDKTQYVFHIKSLAKYGDPAATASSKTTNIICTFDTAGLISCWLGNSDYVTGDARKTTGLTSVNGKFRVFAGPRDDPFFFNLEGFGDAVKAVEDATAAGLTTNAAGCPQLTPSTANTLQTLLKKTAKGTADAKDAFAGKNVLSIAIAVDTATVTTGGKVVGVWASTHKKP